MFAYFCLITLIISIITAEPIQIDNKNLLIQRSAATHYLCKTGCDFTFASERFFLFFA